MPPRGPRQTPRPRKAEPDAEPASILDASALIAFLHDEPGSDAVVDAITATAAVSITVSNGTGTGDTTPPTVAITKPSNGAWTGNSIDVTASGGDNVGLATLTYFGDGSQFAQVSCGGAATCQSTQWWLTGSLASGQHTITVVATDTSGNKTTSAPVVINK